MTELGLWNGEAKRRGMHYGDYVAAVKNGLLPPPKREYVTFQPPTKKRVCRECGMKFEVRLHKDGTYGQTTLCPACRDVSRRNDADCKYNLLTEYVDCEICGKKYKRSIDADGRLKHKKICKTCQSKMRDNKYGTCGMCGELFPLHVTPSGSVSPAKFCPECRKKAAHTKHISDGADDTHYICANCGKRCERPTDSKGRKTSRRYCDDCGGGEKKKRKKLSAPFTDGYTTHTRGR